MSESFYKIAPPLHDIGLLLRAHAELRCLYREVMPVLRQLETGEDLPDEQCGAAMAYLEVSWLEARSHARETDCAHEELHGQPSADFRSSDREEDLYSGACRYYEAVKALRMEIASRVSLVLGGSKRELQYVPEATSGLST